VATTLPLLIVLLHAQVLFFKNSVYVLFISLHNSFFLLVLHDSNYSEGIAWAELTAFAVFTLIMLTSLAVPVTFWL
jgi:hypothetical protein